MALLTKQRSIYRNRRAIILALLAVGFTALINTPPNRPMFRPLAAGAIRVVDGEAQEAPAATGTTLTYNSGSSVKVQQIIGDCDWAVKAANGTCQQTASRTITNANIAANDIGDSFDMGDKIVFMFGDTKSNDPSQPWSTSNLPFVDYHQHDPIATTTVTDGEAPLAINFLLTSAPGAAIPTPFFVEPTYLDGTKLPMGGDDVPHAGLVFNGKTYIIINTGADFSLADPHQNSYSVLATWDGTANANAFTVLRTISKLPGGHFVVTSVTELDPTEAGGSQTVQGVLTYGIGETRASNIYLAFDFGVANDPALAGAPGYESGAATKYFTGLTSGQPNWSSNESDAAAIVNDVVTPPTVAHVSVTYQKDLGLWLMTFDGGRAQQPDGTPTNGSSATDGVYFTYAPAPWGPWATPQLIFNATRDSGFGVFMHNGKDNPPGPIGPTAGTNDPNTTTGTVYAPNMIARFTKIMGNTLSIYYAMSTWNPYTVVEMRSDFNVVVPPDFSLGFDQPEPVGIPQGKVPVTLRVNRTGGFTGNVTITPSDSLLPPGIRLPGFPASTTADSLSFKIKLKGHVPSGKYPIVFAGKDDSGRERDATLLLVVP
jgi:hypothetical protein